MFTEMNQIRHVFSMIWLLEILNIHLRELLQVKNYVIKHSMLPKIQEFKYQMRIFFKWANTSHETFKEKS